MTPNVAAAELPRGFQQHVAQVEYFHHMVNVEDILKQKLFEFPDEKYFKGQHKV